MFIIINKAAADFTKMGEKMNKHKAHQKRSTDGENRLVRTWW